MPSPPSFLFTVSPMDNEVHPIAFHSHTFTPPELNYDVHDKELLAIFEAFKIWHHYLKGSLTPIDMVMDHKNLEYFSNTKLLTHHQVRWSEFLCQFNLTICFHPGHLGTKPDALMRWWDVYSKEGGSNYASICSNYRVEIGAVGIKNLSIWLIETPQWLSEHWGGKCEWVSQPTYTLFPPPASTLLSMPKWTCTLCMIWFDSARCVGMRALKRKQNQQCCVKVTGFWSE